MAEIRRGLGVLAHRDHNPCWFKGFDAPHACSRPSRTSRPASKALGRSDTTSDRLWNALGTGFPARDDRHRRETKHVGHNTCHPSRRQAISDLVSGSRLLNPKWLSPNQIMQPPKPTLKARMPESYPRPSTNTVSGMSSNTPRPIPEQAPTTS